MDRTEIINFIDRIRPELKGSDPEGAILKEARKSNLSPAQLEAIGQNINIAQQLRYMKHASDRGAPFRLLQVPDMIDSFTAHQPKEAMVRRKGDKWQLLSKDGNKVLGTHDSAKEAYAQEYAIQKSQERAKSASDAVTVHESAPDFNRMAKQAAGEERPLQLEIRTTERIPHDLPMAKSANFRRDDRDATKLAKEIQQVNDLIADASEEIRKVARDLARRTHEEGFSWEGAREDAAELGYEKAASIVHTLLPKNITERPAPPQGALARDRYGVMDKLAEVADHMVMIADAQIYADDLEKRASQTRDRTRRSTRDYESSQGRVRTVKKQQGDPEEGDLWRPESNASKILDSIITRDALRSGDELADDLEKRIQSTSGTMAGVLEKVPSPRQVLEGGRDALEFIAPSRNKAQITIDRDMEGARNVTTLQRLMLSDPIIRDADPDQVVSMYNTLANANPDMAGDPNHMRLALREALAYDALPLHTYKEMVEADEKKQKARETKEKTDDLTKKYRR